MLLSFKERLEGLIGLSSGGGRYGRIKLSSKLTLYIPQTKIIEEKKGEAEENIFVACRRATLITKPIRKKETCVSIALPKIFIHKDYLILKRITFIGSPGGACKVVST